MLDFIKWTALVNVVVVGVVVGAGLPALFALGVRALDGPGARLEDGSRPVKRVVVAVACFGAVIASLIWAVTIVATGGH